MNRSQRGMWVVVAMFVIGGIALAGLFLAPRGKPPKLPATTRATAPATMP